MPDVSRSDSQRSDASCRPRVSFNRDVHVKRIVPRPGERDVGILSGEIKDHSFRSQVRKEPLKKSKKELEKEAAKVLEKAKSIECVVSSNRGNPQEKYYTLPNRRKSKLDYGTADRKKNCGPSSELEYPPKKPPRTFAKSNDSKPSVFDIFKKTEVQKPKKSNLRRSVSDATNLKSSALRRRNRDEPDGVARNENENNTNRNITKKQLSPIIEVQQREDYFTTVDETNKENEANNNDNEVKSPTRKKWKKSENIHGSAIDLLKTYIDEIDGELSKEAKLKNPQTERNSEPEVVIIDLDKAEQISRHKNSKTTALGKKLKSLTARRVVDDQKVQNRKKINEKLKLEAVPESPTPKIKKAIKSLENNEQNPSMIHSSQKPAEKPPLTKGRTVNTMVKRLSSDSSTSPPPKTNILVTPNVSVQHNNNQPFSYTRGVSPEKYNANDPGSPVIYAQVVCANGATGPSKQTVHTVFTSNVKKHPQHSDSDEGLGYEEHFNRKYNVESPHSKKYENRFVPEMDREEYFMEADEHPINQKSRTYFNGYSYDKMFERGRADGMDSKRRESLSESIENGTPKFNGTSGTTGKSDWSARRDLLESRINRRLNDKITRISPPNNSNVYISETTSKFYRNGSTSPVGFEEKYNLESRTDRFGERYSESRNRKNFGDRKDDVEYISNGRYPYGHKSMESHVSDYRSSPETRRFETRHNWLNDKYSAKIDRQQRLAKERGIYQSNPEIFKRVDQPSLESSYHDSLRREKRIYKSDRFLDNSESDRKDKFGDSGIENDIKRDSVDHFRSEPKRIYGRNTESEDEGFASSLLIANERQHADEAIISRKTRDFEYEAPYEREEYEYRKPRAEYVPRERSIDDGSHYDPRIDKDFENEREMAKKIKKKPPKPEKKSSLEKVKQLFMSSSKKKKEKQTMVREEDLRSRYKEYKGSTEHLEPHMKRTEMRQQTSSYDYRNRSRLPTPSPEPQKNGYSKEHTNGHISDSNMSHTSWFKSLDRLSRKKNRKDEKDGNLTSAEEELTPKSPPTKSLRFFGDSLRQRTTTSRSRTDISGRDRIKSQSNRDLHNISEERKPRQENGVRSNHKSMLNISESDRETTRSKSSLKPPISPSHKSRDLPRRDERSRRSKNEVSSLESSTEGDSSQQSQQSQRSIVYLHAATVGDIPGPGYLKNSSRAASREELSSNGSKIQPRVKTLSRSFSMLAPWKPRHYRESMDIDYSQYPKPQPVHKNGKYEQRVSRNGTSRNSTSSTLKKKAHETRRSNQNVSNINGGYRSRSKENISSSLKRPKDEPSRSSTSTLYKKKEKLPRENSRYSREKDDRRISSKSVSVESLGGQSRSSRRVAEDGREVSRSLSMPRDPEKSAGWFKMGRKNNKNITTQRL